MIKLYVEIIFDTDLHPKADLIKQLEELINSECDVPVRVKEIKKGEL